VDSKWGDSFWLATKVARALKPNEQSASDGREIKEIIVFFAIVTDLEEEDDNTHDVNAIINLTNPGVQVGFTQFSFISLSLQGPISDGF